ncbi:MAG: glycosyltransferase family 1 protein [Rhodothermaceae bacterium]|nr:glycosyltransferase family 1 protein [Rhodothermaceae bacterium]
MVPKKIALFSGAFNHIADGVTLTLNRLVKHLVNNGSEVRVFAPTVERPAISHVGTLIPTPSIPMPGRPEYRISTGLSRRIRKELKEFKPDIIHIATPDVVGLKALWLAKRLNIPVVSSYHTHFTSYFKYYKMEWLENWTWSYLRWFYSQCEQIYVPSESMADVLRGYRITENLHLWERGVLIDLFTPERRNTEWRRQHGIGENEVVISFISRLVWEKGLDIYAKVIEALSEKGIPHRSVIVGDGPVREELEARLTNTLFLGYQRGEDLATAYACSDIFLFPSETETFGNVTLEAMASGIPAVCADATGSRSLIRDGITGYLATPSDDASFLHYVERLALDETLRQTMGRLARKRALEFAWPVILSKIEGYYDTLLGYKQLVEVPEKDAELVGSV